MKYLLTQLEKELSENSETPPQNGLKWKSLNHREIKLREHMSQNEQSTVISSLLYREISSEIFKNIRKLEDRVRNQNEATLE